MTKFRNMKSKMTGEVCMFDKFGFCKWGTSCNKVHLKETCLLEECESRKCLKRHPRPCKFLTGGCCKYGENCRFDHRPPKYIRSLVSRLDALEKENKNLHSIIEDQEKKIDRISEKDNPPINLNDKFESLDKIQKQINQLILANKKKTEAIKQLDKDLDGMNQFFKSHIDTIYEDIENLESNKNQEEVELDEKVVDEEDKSTSLKILDVMEEDIKKCRKNGKDIKEKFNLHCDQIIRDVEQQDCNDLANEMKSVLKKAEKEQRKFGKDDCLKTINEFRERFIVLS